MASAIITVYRGRLEAVFLAPADAFLVAVFLVAAFLGDLLVVEGVLAMVECCVVIQQR